jgi:hypothetical protein
VPRPISVSVRTRFAVEKARLQRREKKEPAAEAALASPSEHHRVERGRHAEEVADRVRPALHVQVIDRLRRPRGEEAPRRLLAGGLDEDLHAVAGGDHERLGHALHRLQLLERRLERVAGQGDPLAHLDGRALVAEPDEEQLAPAHCPASVVSVV